VTVKTFTNVKKKMFNFK